MTTNTQHANKSVASSLWKTIRAYPVRSGLAIGGFVSIAALIFSKKPKENQKQDELVEDFSQDQEAMLQRVREIWDEHNRDSHENGADKAIAHSQR